MPVSRFVASPLVGIFTVILMTACITTWFVIMLPFIVLRLTPIYRVQRFASGCCVRIATWWTGCNHFIYGLMHGRFKDVVIEGHFDPKKSYLVLSNHQAWADIQILFDQTHKRTPFGRFFLKSELIWVPIIGVVCWAMDFPFMKRHNHEKLARNPELAKEDLETTRKACQIYKKQPVAVINFLEGTRFSPKKRDKQRSTYTHLLKPKYGGLSASLNAMGEQFEAIVDVTLVYRPTLKNKTWSWLCGEQQDMKIRIRTLDIPEKMITGDYRNDSAFKAEFKQWVHAIWVEKDQTITALKEQM